MHIDFWDVGQADCSVITLPSGKLFIIDVGRLASPLVDWLNERPIAPEIEAILLTHNDSDHAGALTPIVKEHKKRIGAIWMLADRRLDNEKFLTIFRAALSGEKEGCYRIERVEAGKTLYESTSLGVKLHIIAPTFSDNIQAMNPNETSGVVVLDSDANRLLTWPGDRKILNVVEILEGRSTWMLHGPHHGGPSDFPSASFRRDHPPESWKNRIGEIRDAIRKISPSRSFISVGTRSIYNHPRPRYLKILAERKTRVTCSQITPCCDRKAISEERPVFDGAAALGLRSPRTGVPCRGCLRLKLENGRLIPDKFDAIHLERIANLLRPQCLKGAFWQKGDEPPSFME